jgi:hypothetical protein
MTSRRWRAAALLAPAAITVALATPAVAATTPSWQLTNEFASKPVCYTPKGASLPLEINLNGSWSHSLTFGAASLPAGGSYSDSVYLFSDTGIVESVGPPPIPPGSSNGTGPYTVNSTSFGEAYAVTDIPAGMAAGSTFNITLWASDGTTTQTESVPVVIKASCARRY